MMNDGTDAPAEHRPMPPGWGERAALVGMAAIVSFFVNIFLRMVIEPLAGRHPARAVAVGLSMAVFFEIAYGTRSIRSFLTTAGMCLVAASALEWWN